MISTLAAGARVRLIAPAVPMTASLEELVTTGSRHLREWGLEVRFGTHIRDRHPTLPYLGGTDADRAADLVQAWCDPEVDAIICLRGGYGCLRIIDLLDWDKMAAAEPKLFAGSSDVTALHQEFQARLGVPTLFSPMIATQAFAHDETTRAGLRHQLFEGPRPVTGGTPLVPGRARGTTAGGNLSLLAANLGQRPPDGSILLLEDINEHPYRVDRLLTQLLRADWFTRVAGIALGTWTGCGDVDPVLAERLSGLGVPVAAGLPFGHCAAQATIPLGVPAELDADAGTLTISNWPPR